MTEMTLIEAIRQAMDEELARDERVFITGEDVGVRGGVFRATQGLFEKYGEVIMEAAHSAEGHVIHM